MFRVRDNILESIQDGIIAVDSNLNIEFVNKVAKKILNCQENEKINLINEKVFAEKILSQTLQTGKSITIQAFSLILIKTATLTEELLLRHWLSSEFLPNLSEFNTVLHLLCMN